MEVKNNNAITNSNRGKNRTYRSINKFVDKAEAVKEFSRATEKLFNINKWSKLPGISSSFQLYNAQGQKKLIGIAETYDYIKINLPGPFPENWVKITKIKQDEHKAEFTVHPSNKPVAKGKDMKKTVHFFAEESRSTFKVERKGEKLYGYEIGKNEIINNEGKEAAGRKAINTLIAEGGWAGFQKFQWKKLIDYFVHKTEIEK